MRLIDVEVHNACQFEHVKAEFPVGIVGIFGPNGCGKSNLMKLAKASLTGEYKANAGVKADNVRCGTSDHEPAYIRATWEHAGNIFKVTRGLQLNVDKLVLGNGETLSGANAVTAHIENILGLSKKIIDGFVFVDQWKIFEFLSDKPENRANTFAHLCGTVVAEKLWSLLGKAISADVKNVVDLDDSSNRISERIESLTERNGEIEKELAARKRDLLSPSQQVQLQAVVTAKTESDFLSHQIAEAEGKLEETKQLLPVRQQAVADGTKAVAKTAALKDELGEAAAEAKAQIAIAGEQEKRRARKLEVLRTLKKVPPAPVPPQTFDSTIEELLSERALKLRELKEAQRIVCELGRDGVTACPTCGTPTSALTDKIEQLIRITDTYPELINQFDEQIRIQENYQDACAVFTTARTQYLANRAAANAELETLKDVPNEPFDMAAAEAVLKSYRVACVNAKQNATTLQTVTEVLSKLEQRIDSLTESLATWRKEAKEKHVSKKDVTAATEKLDKHTEAAAVIETLKQELARNRILLRQENEELAAIAEREKRSKSYKQWTDELQTWRNILHRDALPRLVAQRQLEALTKTMNRHLSDFEGPFRVEAGDELSFIAVKPSGAKEHAERLSGGEKVVLALAFRLAVNELFARDAGMMILDEPTVGLDSSNTESLIGVLEKLAVHVKSLGNQIIIITHNTGLDRAFSERIYVPDL